MFSALGPDIAPETAVLRRKPPKTLLEHPPKRTTFYMLLCRRKLTNVCSHLSVAFVVGFPGLHKTTKKSTAEPRYIPSKPKTFFGRKTHDYELLRLEDVAIYTAAVSYVELLILKLYFEAKTPLFTPSTDQPVFSVVEVLACFWIVSGQSGVELPIFRCP